MTDNEEQREEAPKKLNKHSQTLKALVYPLKVIISPFKAFPDIVQNPNFIGVIFIVALFLLASVSAECLRASKIILDAETQSTSLFNSNFLSTSLNFILIQSAFSFLLNWIIYAGVLLLMIRLFREKSGQMSPFFVIVGYVFSVIVIYVVIQALLILTLPEIHFESSAWYSGTLDITNTINQVWGPTLAYQAMSYLGLAFQFWLVMLGSIAIHVSSEIKWIKAIMISGIAYFISFFLITFLTLLSL